MKDEVTLANYDIIGTIFFIGTLIVSVILSYNDKLKLDGKDGLFSNEERRNILIINKIVVLCLVVFFLYINLEHYKIALIKGDDTTNYKIQLIPSILAIIAAVIILYLVLKGDDEVDNPEL